MTPTTTGLMPAEEFWDFVHRPENQGRSFALVREPDAAYSEGVQRYADLPPRWSEDVAPTPSASS